jgi:hypothetical protein
MLFPDGIEIGITIESFPQLKPLEDVCGTRLVVLASQRLPEQFAIVKLTAKADPGVTIPGIILESNFAGGSPFKQSWLFSEYPVRMFAVVIPSILCVNVFLKRKSETINNVININK